MEKQDVGQDLVHGNQGADNLSGAKLVRAPDRQAGDGGQSYLTACFFQELRGGCFPESMECGDWLADGESDLAKEGPIFMS